MSEAEAEGDAESDVAAHEHTHAHKKPRMGVNGDARARGHAQYTEEECGVCEVCGKEMHEFSVDEQMLQVFKVHGTAWCGVV